MPHQTPPKHVPLIQSFLLITLRENKVITKYVRFCQMLFKKPHKIVYEVTSDSYVKKIPPPFPNSFYSTPYPAHLPSNPTHEKFNFPFQKWCTSNSSLLCVSWFPLWFSLLSRFPVDINGVSRASLCFFWGKK